MSDDAKPLAALSSPNMPRSSKRRPLLYAFYAVGALGVLVTFAYIDGGEEPLHPIVQSVSLTMPASPASGTTSDEAQLQGIRP